VVSMLNVPSLMASTVSGVAGRPALPDSFIRARDVTERLCFGSIHGADELLPNVQLRRSSRARFQDCGSGRAGHDPERRTCRLVQGCGGGRLMVDHQPAQVRGPGSGYLTEFRLLEMLFRRARPLCAVRFEVWG